MAQLDKDYVITMDVNTCIPIERDRKLYYFNTDVNTCNLFLLLHKGEYKDNISNFLKCAEDYTCVLRIVKSKKYIYKIEGKLFNVKHCIFEFELSEEITKTSGDCVIEFFITNNKTNKSITSESLKLKIKPSIKNGIQEDTSIKDSRIIRIGDGSLESVQTYADFECLNSEKGVVLVSPSGNKFRITVDDRGNITSTPIG